MGFNDISVSNEKMVYEYISNYNFFLLGLRRILSVIA